jgi:hypothetical protein
MANQLTGFQIFIGAKNGAPNGIFEPGHHAKLVKILKSKNYGFSGFTITDGAGYWSPDGGETEYWEDCKVVTVFLDEKEQGHKFNGLINQLCQNLGQVAIAVVKLGRAGVYFYSGSDLTTICTPF